MSEFVPGPDTKRALRDAMGRFATGVTIVTARTADGPLGITANSFTSVSLDPPLVLWSPAKRSARCAAFCAAPEFAIHVLAADQAPLAMQFARSGTEFDPAHWQIGDDGLPLLTHYAARFVCRPHAQHDAGDHVLIIGEVTRACAGGISPPLVFTGGRYGTFRAD
ncbi:flavin reductase family protein [Actibacterium ureilyticum]|uniref:flavin reductase family protein n=1 Tax=Actibacterium ureilyticum TaxID=1590614 RepID=UPI000BAB100E|nr:flavin reductase family protein [Actibacterium ureilyticum]